MDSELNSITGYCFRSQAIDGEDTGYGLHVAGCGLRVAGCELRVAGHGLRVTCCGQKGHRVGHRSIESAGELKGLGE